MPKIVSEKLGEIEEAIPLYKYPKMTCSSWETFSCFYIYNFFPFSCAPQESGNIYLSSKKPTFFYVDVVPKASKYHHFVSYYKSTFIIYIFKLSAPGVFAVVFVSPSKCGNHVNKKYQ